MEKELLSLLKEYRHYKRMTVGFWKWLFGTNQGIDFGDFIQWLESRN